MFRKVTIITDTRVERLFRRGFPVGTAYFQAYVRASAMVNRVVSRGVGFPIGPVITNHNLQWLEKPTSPECEQLVRVLEDCARVEAVITVGMVEQSLTAGISILRGKFRYGFLSIGVHVFGKHDESNLEYAVLETWNFDVEKV